jgi:hypothetical protein
MIGVVSSKPNLIYSANKYKMKFDNSNAAVRALIGSLTDYKLLINKVVGHDKSCVDLERVMRSYNNDKNVPEQENYTHRGIYRYQDDLASQNQKVQRPLIQEETKLREIGKAAIKAERAKRLAIVSKRIESKK